MLTEFKGKLPAGKYYIGDPFYFLDQNIYNNDWIKKNQAQDGEFKYHDKPYVIAGTAHGDGYYDSNGTYKVHHGFPVDSGTIGIIDRSLGKTDELVDTVNNSLGTIVDVKTEIDYEFSDGCFCFKWDQDNTLTIMTDVKDEYEEDDDEY